MAARDPEHRKLAAIMFLDMVGYSAVAHRDDQLAHALLTELKQLVRLQLARFDGREIRTMGDGFLVEFSSAVAAVQCGAAIQNIIHLRNSREAANRHFQVRIGLHLGDVLCEGDDILGDGVNIAARVEPLASPGGICFTQQVFDQVRSHSELRIVPMGAAQLKNIPTAIPIYQIPPPGAAPEWQGQLPPAPAGAARRRWPLRTSVGIGAAVVLLLALVLWGYHQAVQASNPQRLVILPFRAVSAGATNEALGDGFVETLAARLTQLQLRRPNLHVVPMTEVRGAQVTTADAARTNFGATHLLVGSVERSGDLLRLNVALVDAATHTQLHACTTNGLIGSVFLLQDAIAELAAGWLGVPGAVPPGGNLSRDIRPPGAYEQYLMGIGKIARADVAENIDDAIRCFEQALAFDENYAAARAGLALAYWKKHLDQYRPEWVAEARRQAERALALDTNLFNAHLVLGNIALGGGAPLAEALTHLQRAVDLDPVNAEAWSRLGIAYFRSDRRADALRIFRSARERGPEAWDLYNRLGQACCEIGQYAEATQYFRKATALAPDSYNAHYNLSAAYLLRGAFDQAIASAEKSLTLRKTAEAYSNLGTAFFYQRKFGLARDNYRLAIATGPATYEWWGNLGDACRYLPAEAPAVRPAYEQAVALAHRALQVRPDDALTLSYLACYLQALDQSEAARTHLTRALSLAPQVPEVLFNAALVWELSGQRSNALATLARARAQGFSEALIKNHPELDLLRPELHLAP